ncbi:MAG: hypothetical protein KAS72_14635 [Phycisphaerales bacterium]|nr:hypothetical protein [Phycisphaerales bacterium]
MSRLSESLVIIAAALIPLLMGGAEALSADDEMERYLLDRGFDELLALYWEDELRTVQGTSRKDLVARLATVYGELLARSEDADTKARWEAKARALLPEMSETDSTALQLELIRVRYIPAERVAEEYRLRLVTEQQRADTAAALAELADELRRLDDILQDRIEHLARLASREGRRAEQAAETLADLSRLEAWASYYRGWSLYYLGLLENDPQPAYDAMLAFGRLLGARDNRLPNLLSFPSDQMRYEERARTALAVALCLSLRGEPNEAVRWLDKLEQSDDVPDSIREQLALRRLFILGNGGQWAAFARARQAIEEERPLTALEARLIAIVAFEWHRRQGDGRSLDEAAIALSRLGDAGELGHVLDLARRYGADALGTSGFVACYVKGLEAYQQARNAHAAQGGGDRPTTDERLATRYRVAIQHFRTAVQSADVSRFAQAVRSAHRHRALALYYAGRFEEAVDEFLLDAAYDDDRAAESLYLACGAVDAAIRASDAGPDLSVLRITRQSLFDQYLRRFPNGAHAAMVTIKKATTASLRVEDSVAMLLSVPAGTDAYETARRHASRYLWDQLQAVRPFEKPTIAQRYIEVAGALLSIDRERGEAGDAEAQALFVGRARRLIDAAMTFGLEDMLIARRIIAYLEFAVDQAWRGTSDLRPELIYRRVQVKSAEGDLTGAVSLALSCRSDHPASPYAVACTKRVFATALVAWRNPDNTARTEGSELVIRLGELLLSDFGGEAPAITGLGPAAVRSIAEAYVERSERDDAAQDRTRAAELYLSLIETGGAGAVTYVAAARLSEGKGDAQRALALWNEAVAQLDEGTERWFEAKYNVFRLLSASDASLAREAIAQYRVLRDGYGPEPWGSRIAQLAVHLGMQPEAEAVSP